MDSQPQPPPARTDRSITHFFFLCTLTFFASASDTTPSPNVLVTRCTIGISLPRTLYTTTSPTSARGERFHRNSRSPRWNAGSMLPDSTTTMGDDESVATPSPFHIMKAVDRTRAKLRTCVRVWRGLGIWEETEESMAAV